MNQNFVSHSAFVACHLEERKPISDPINLAERLYRLRISQGLTVSQLATRTGLPSRILWKIETGRTSPRVGVLHAILTALGVDFETLFAMKEGRGPLSRPVITPVNSGRLLSMPPYRNRLLCSDLLDKKMLPLITILKSSENLMQGWEGHDGEVLLFVLKGRVILRGQAYEPLLLNQGDNVYFDGNTHYQLNNDSSIDAELLWVTSTF